jgi:hypothetical protein
MDNNVTRAIGGNSGSVTATAVTSGSAYGGSVRGKRRAHSRHRCNGSGATAQRLCFRERGLQRVSGLTR